MANAPGSLGRRSIPEAFAWSSSVRRSLHHPPPERSLTSARWPHLTERDLVVSMFALAALAGDERARDGALDDLRAELSQRRESQPDEGRR